MAKKYAVDLSEAEQHMLNEMITSGTQRVRKMNHARILLKAHAGWTDQAIAEALNINIPTIQRVRQRFIEQGFEQALNLSPTRRKYQRLLDGVQAAHLIALVCSAPPKGYRRWSLRLLAVKMVELAYVDELSHETVRQVLNENELKPWLWKELVHPTQRKHTVRLPYGRCPRSLSASRQSTLSPGLFQALPMKHGQPERWDYEYHRE